MAVGVKCDRAFLGCWARSDRALAVGVRSDRASGVGVRSDRALV